MTMPDAPIPPALTPKQEQILAQFTAQARRQLANDPLANRPLPGLPIPPDWPNHDP